MDIDWTYDGCDEHDVPGIEQYWERVQIELDGKLAELSDAATELRIAVERDDSNPAWEIQAALHLPGHTLVARSEAQRAEQALDEILHSLAAQIDELAETPERVTQRREGLEGIVQLLQACHAQRRSQAFLSFLIPLVNSLGPYVQRELNVRESDGTLDGEELDTSDILDGVLVEAWETFGRRDARQPFDLWLVQLADNIFDRLTAEVSRQSLDEPALTPVNDGMPFEGDSWIEQVSYPETIDLSELLPDKPDAQIWDDSDTETKQSHLSEMLSKFDRDRRQAFVLNVAHGFSVAEIADFQDREAVEIESDVAHVTAAIRRWFVDEQTPDREEPFARAEMRERQRRR